MAGLLIAGFVGVLRSDTVAKEEAQEVKEELKARIDLNEIRHGEIIFAIGELRAEIAGLRAKVEMLVQDND
jgi:hypothetical protein